VESILDALIASEPFERLLTDRAPSVVARADAGQDFVVAALARALDAPILAVAPGPREAEALEHGVGALLGRDRVALLPPWEALPSEAISPSAEVVARRARAARAVRAADGPFVLVASAHAAVQPISPTLLEAEPVLLEEGMELAPDDLAQRLVGLGYTRADIVEHRGEFAVRGGIVDVFPGTGGGAVGGGRVGEAAE
jgi:transcription-repair coupling factor (superfamily II helicase)